MNTKEFIEKLDTDEALQKKFEGVNKPEKFFEIALENGLTDDFETMKAVASQLLKEQTNNNTFDLSQLEQISGGDDNSVDPVFSWTFGTAISAIAVSTAGAAS